MKWTLDQCTWDAFTTAAAYLKEKSLLTLDELSASYLPEH